MFKRFVLQLTVLNCSASLNWPLSCKCVPSLFVSLKRCKFYLFFKCFDPSLFEFGQVQRYWKKKFIFFYVHDYVLMEKYLNYYTLLAGVYFLSLITVPLVIDGYFVNKFDAFQVSSLNTRPDFLLWKYPSKEAIENTERRNWFNGQNLTSV